MQFNIHKPLSSSLILHIFDFAGEQALIPCTAVSRAFRDQVKELWDKKVKKLCQQPAFLRTFVNLTFSQQAPLPFLREIFTLSCSAKERRQATKQSIESQARACVQASSLALQTQLQIEQEWAANLNAFFEGVANQCQEAKHFLASLKDQRLHDKAENIFLWFQEKNNQKRIEKIQELDLSNKSLTNLPYEIGLFKGLKKLIVTGNKLASLPNNFGSLVHLQWLYLINNQLSSLPTSIESLVNLLELYLGNNQLTSLPSSIGSLVNLQKLYLINNQLSSLPEVVKGCRVVR